MAVNRVLGASEKFPSWRASLDRLFGIDDWREELLPVSNQRSLFGEEEQRSKVAIEQIGRYFVRRLESVFPAVAQKPAILGNAVCPLYLLCFAAGNKKGGKVALDIADYILKAEG
jgi:hypothetical protein